jgi:hypothetical protein
VPPTIVHTTSAVGALTTTNVGCGIGLFVGDGVGDGAMVGVAAAVAAGEGVALATLGDGLGEDAAGEHALAIRTRAKASDPRIRPMMPRYRT